MPICLQEMPALDIYAIYMNACSAKGVMGASSLWLLGWLLLSSSLWPLFARVFLHMHTLWYSSGFLYRVCTHI
jgi:hypothetical protein